MSFSSWFRGLKGKLLGLIALPVLAMATMIGVSLYTVDQLREGMTLSTDRVATTRSSGAMAGAINGAVRWLWTAYALDPKTAANERKEMIAKASEDLQNIQSFFDKYRTEHRTADFIEMEKPIEENLPKLMAAGAKVIAALSSSNPAENAKVPEIIAKEFRPVGVPMSAALEKIIDRRAKLAHESAITLNHNADVQKSILMAVSAAGMALSIILGFLIALQLSKVLRGVTSKIAEAGEQVSASSMQLSAAAQQVSSGSTEAASSLEETVSSIEELSSMVQLNAGNATQAASLSGASTQAALKGEEEIRSLIDSMTEISQSSKKIEEIINVIDDIAFQTNLLALNAAVEAARAGEQGKGFAVVAEAVRNLAQRSSSAAKDITALIKESVEKTQRGSRIADSSGAVLKEIVTSIKKVSDLNNEIASASGEQANGLQQISKAMNQLDTSTQQNAAASEEVAASSEEMSAQAALLQQLVGELNLVVEGTRPTHTLRRPPNVHTQAQRPRLELVKKTHYPAEKGEHAPEARTGTDGF